ncbi:hypothetical protein VTI74DRAFT_6675 [Chaetomium olivicolor]
MKELWWGRGELDEKEKNQGPFISLEYKRISDPKARRPPKPARTDHQQAESVSEVVMCLKGKVISGHDLR